MATNNTESGISINSKAITSAVDQIIQKHFSDMPPALQVSLKDAALNCISDEMDHALNPSNINQTFAKRLDLLVEESKKAGYGS